MCEGGVADAIMSITMRVIQSSAEWGHAGFYTRNPISYRLKASPWSENPLDSVNKTGFWITHTGNHKLESDRRQCDEAQRDMRTSNI